MTRKPIAPVLLLLLLGCAAPAAAQASGRPEAACGWLGFTYDLRWNARGEIQDGLHVRQVVPRGPAARAGLAPGDVVTAVDGAPLTVALLSALTRDSRTGRPVRLSVRRAGREVLLSARAEPPPAHCRSLE